MGICVSCDAADEGATTARVVLPSGELREYSPPATASLVLQEAGAGWFLCDADVMGLEDAAAVAGAGEGLRPGQIYFVLPVEMRRRRLTGEEVAALAVKASSALVKAAAAATTAPSSPCRRRRSSVVAPLVFPLPEENEYAAAEPTSPIAVTTAAVRKRRVSTRGGRATRFSSDLTAIPESE